MALEKEVKIATIYDVSESVAKEQEEVDNLWPVFDKWWRNKYHYHTMDARGAVILWVEFKDLIKKGVIKL